MKLEQQVCSLELAKKLKELGVKQESLFYWSRNKETKMEYKLGEFIGVYQPWETVDTEHAFSAFTVAELGEMLPMEPFLPEAYEFQTFKLTKGRWTVQYLNGRKVKAFQMADTEADARAKMLVYLLENKLITIN